MPLCYKIIGSCFSLCVYRIIDALGKFESTQEARVALVLSTGKNVEVEIEMVHGMDLGMHTIVITAERALSPQ